MEGGFQVIEKVFSRIYLENYQFSGQIYEPMVTGNLWSLVSPMKNGNFISLLLYGSLVMYVVFFSLRDFSSKRLIHSFLLIFQSVLTFGLFP